ncbi:hypothetical protein CCR94_04370 [Rhodoblastus sphagnicola]|uniref:Glycosyltransferase subfamily 4-like N-terminal domain-containing protein n=1 Tax=Rhodoblastus sphagnicola TaxID=333368 RepID=A0A2S6NDQ2_9HYPH|nr:glycosyltransferase family 4 protein [Rhodoblastus sphagnicola]MBB4200113.1 glycosyltransferase involved in cell wall biosynthesis [Rhodoblastus sphagnicola]PPQ32727.1 hypothetical protein CCR94_04370 [Rhodoblastus sphagnicola]
MQDVVSINRSRLHAVRVSKPLRIVHFSGICFGITGLETFLWHLCAAQKRAGLVPSIVLDVNGREELRAIAKDRGVTLHPLPLRQGLELRLPQKVGGALMRMRRIKMLVDLLRKSDVLHIHEGVIALDAFLAARIAGVGAIIVTHHGTLAFHKAYWKRQKALSFWLEKRWASRIVLPYEAAAGDFVAAGVAKDRVSIVPFCVDENHFAGLAAEPEPGKLTLVIAARLVAGKGHLDLIAAIAQIASRFPGLRLLIAGDGPMRPEIEAKIAESGLGRIIEFRGGVDHSDMPELLRCAHLMVLPSAMFGETFPLCLLEGMALGLPAIGTRWFGIQDIIVDGETGILVEPHDVMALARAIERFLTEPGFYSRARRNALARFNARYTSTTVADAYSRFYEAERLRDPKRTGYEIVDSIR